MGDHGSATQVMLVCWSPAVCSSEVVISAVWSRVYAAGIHIEAHGCIEYRYVAGRMEYRYGGVWRGMEAHGGIEM